MKKVEEIMLVITDDVAKDPSNVEERDKFLKKERKSYIPLIKKHVNVEKCKVSDFITKFELKNGITIEKGIEIVHSLEEKYDVTLFSYNSERAEFYDDDPELLIWMKTK